MSATMEVNTERGFFRVACVSRPFILVAQSNALPTKANKG